MMVSFKLYQSLRLDLTFTSLLEQVVMHQLPTLTPILVNFTRSDGFKKAAFSKDNKAYITSIIPPKSSNEALEPIDWLSIRCWNYDQCWSFYSFVSSWI